MVYRYVHSGIVQFCYRSFAFSAFFCPNLLGFDFTNTWRWYCTSLTSILLSPSFTAVSRLGMEPSSRMELDQTTTSRCPTRRRRRRRRTTPSTHSTRRIWKRRPTLDYVDSTTYTLKLWIHTQRAFKSVYHLIYAYHNIMRSIGVIFEEVWVWL